MRAWLALTRAAALRLVREPMLARALAWPTALLMVVPFATLALAAVLFAPPEIAAAGDAAVALEAAGFTVRPDPDPATAVEGGRADRAAWRDGERWVLDARHGGWLRSGDRHRLATLRAEATLRALDDRGWQLSVGPVRSDAPPPMPIGASDEGPPAAVPALHDPVGAALGLLFVLYGAVIGVSTTRRDRAALEACLSLPVRPATLAAAELAAAGGVLAAALAVTFLARAALAPPMPGAGAAWAASTAGAVEATALALALATLRSGWVGPSKASASSGLTAALAALAALAGVGLSAPAVGRWLPISSVAAAALAEPAPAALHAARAVVVVVVCVGVIDARVRQ